MNEREIAEVLIHRPGYAPNGIMQVGGKLYAFCRDCGSLVRLNKPLLGSLHFCTSGEPHGEQQPPPRL